MNKNWLIRTKNNHILGPVSLEKIKTLLENRSLNSEDELCSGNGYWFSVKEDQLVEKYIYKEIPQSYNPITEAKTVVARKPINDIADKEIDEIQDVTQIGLSLDTLNENKLNIEVELLDLGDPPSVELPVKPKREVKEKTITKAEELNEEIKEFSTTELRNVKALNSTILYIISILFFIIALVGFYFRKTLLENFLG